MINKIIKKINSTLRIYRSDIQTKGVYWAVIHRLFKISFIKLVLIPIVNFLKPDYVMIQNHKLFIDKWDEVVSQELLLSGKWEEYETELFKKHINKGDVVLDIGAHIGYYTLIAARSVGNKGKVYAFEPDLKNFKLLKKNVEENKYKNVVLVNKAVTDISGEVNLFINRKNTGDHRIYDSGGKRKTIGIQAIRLDDFFKNKTKRIDLIKMDIQGSEALAFKGGLRLIKENRNIKILTEFWPHGLKLSGSSAQEYAKLLKGNMFQIYDIDENEKTIKLIYLKTLLEPFRSKTHDYKYLFCIRN